jgi:hypothetical protein
VVDVDASMLRCERPEPALRLLQLPLEPGAVPAAGLVPRDDDVHQPLEEVLLLGRGGAPGVLERLVRGEVIAVAGQFKPAVQINRDRP